MPRPTSVSIGRRIATSVRPVVRAGSAVRAGRPPESLIVAVTAAALAIAMTYPLATGLGSLGRVDSGDGQWSIWCVAWVARTLVADPLHLYDANIFHPHRGTLAYSDANIASGALAAPFYWATGNPYLAHNAVVLIAFAASAIGMYLLARHLTGSRPAAGVAGVLFAFCPHVYAHTAHIQLLMTAVLPFSLLAFHRVVEAPRPTRAIALGLTLVAGALACGYYAVFVALMLGLGGVFYLAARRADRPLALLGAIAVAALIAIALVYPFFRPYLVLESSGRPFRGVQDTVEWSARLGSYLAAAGWGNRWLVRWAPPFNEVLFPGLVTTALALVGLRSLARDGAADRPLAVFRRAAAPVRETTVFYTLVAVLSFWLSFGPEAGLYAVLYRIVPFFSLLRAPARFGLVVTFALVVLAAIGLASLLRTARRPWAIATLVGALALVELAPLPLRYRQVPNQPHVYRVLARLPEGAVAEFPFFYREEDFHRHTRYMLASTMHWKKLVNGYGDYFPQDFRQMVVPVSSFPTLESFEILRARRTRYVVFHPRLYDHRLWPRVVSRLQRYRAYLRPVAADAEAWLYEIVGWPEREPAER